jgi:hypothetical protein
VSSTTDEVAYGVIAAGSLHLVWCWLAGLVGHSVDFKVVLALLVGGDAGDSALLGDAVNVATRDPSLVAVYFLSLCFFALLCGIVCHNFVRGTGLDHRLPWLRFRNEWYYALSGEYTLHSEHINELWHRDGVLDRVVLCEAIRRRLEDDRPSSEAHDYADGDRYYPIVGDQFIIKYSEMQTINIQGIVIADESDSGDSAPVRSFWAQRKRSLGVWLSRLGGRLVGDDMNYGGSRAPSGVDVVEAISASRASAGVVGGDGSVDAVR